MIGMITEVRHEPSDHNVCVSRKQKKVDDGVWFAFSFVCSPESRTWNDIPHIQGECLNFY